ncbi:MAG: glycosyltransferase [Planctomycetes bacterium]|jgi:glycosyltransferase involved in cell wall biosynthesis|nr:glycosyltransferase [Phycisphaerae bacterium]NBB94332.1 glycosyltransferase [Planctomycetota bacterium]
MARISVCHILTDLVPAGAERSVYELATRLDRTRFDVSVVGLRGGAMADRLAEAGIDVEVLGVRSKADVAKLAHLVGILRDRRPDIVHTHLFHADLAGRPAASLAGAGHLVHTVHAIEQRFRPWQFAWARLASRRCRCTICISGAVRRHYWRRTGLPRQSLRVIRNGIDPDAWQPKTDLAQRIREQRGIAGSDIVAAFVGRLHVDKGVDVLAAAAQILGDGSLWLLIAGDGPMRPFVRQFVRGDARADWLGQIDDVRGVLTAADMLVMPSRTEGFGLAALEAMAMGLPVVAARAGGLKEIVVDGETGLLVPPDDPASLAGAIRRLADDADFRRRMGRAGREHVAEQFHINATVAAHERLYAEIVRE